MFKLFRQSSYFDPTSNGFTSVCHFSRENCSSFIRRLQMNYGVENCGTFAYYEHHPGTL